MKSVLTLIGFGMAVILFSGCAASTAHLPPVTGFNADRYLGQWYEIARLPHRFENGLSQVTATYSKEDEPGQLRVVNRGFDAAAGKWREAVGRAEFAADPKLGLLRVTFFRPFYGDYKIIRLDRDYRYAVVTSSRMNYFWILARTPQITPALRRELTDQARNWGFATEQLIWSEPAALTPSPPRQGPPLSAVPQR